MTTRGVLDPAVVDRLRQLTPPGEPDVLAEIFTVFLEEVPRRIERLKAAWWARALPTAPRRCRWARR